MTPVSCCRDFLAPELRAIAVRLDALEARFAQQDQRIVQQDQQRQRDKEDILRAIAQLADYNSLSNRLARLEAERSTEH